LPEESQSAWRSTEVAKKVGGTDPREVLVRQNQNQSALTPLGTQFNTPPEGGVLRPCVATRFWGGVCVPCVVALDLPRLR